MKEIQQRIQQWQQGVYPPAEISPQNMFNRTLEEVGETSVAVRHLDGTKKSKDEVAKEAIDVIIGNVGLVTSLGEYDIGDLINKKIEVMVAKYPPEKVKALTAKGMNHYQAMDQVKQQYKAA